MKKNLFTLVTVLGFSLLLPGTSAGAQIRVMALFPNKAMVSVDGTNRLLRVGKASPEGVTLVSSDSRKAVIEVNGQQDNYSLGTHIQSSFSKPESALAQIWRDESGSYKTVGSINGYTVNMLVDTGATSIAMNALHAKRLGIDYRLKGQKIVVGTASGKATGYSVSLDKVRVGDIEFHNVAGVVVDGSHPTEVLLGMTFLDRVTIENQGQMLTLRTKY